MVEPTQAEMQEFWEKCGLKKPPQSCKEKDHMQVPMGKEDYGDYYCIPVPVDLNNLFKYAVPKLGRGWGIRFGDTYDKEFYCGVGRMGESGDATFNKDPALALFWAIKEALNEK